MHTSCIFTLISLNFFLAVPACAEVIEMGKPLARIALLKEGTHHYLRYLKEGEASAPIDIWTRTVSSGPRGLRIEQRWDSAKGPAASTKWLDSWFEPGTMRPLTHTRITEKEGKKVVEGFVFAPNKISGMQDLADNTQLALDVPSPEPAFNFETDIEFLQALPLAAGYEAVINFYHPGGSAAPARYTFKVAGSATIAGPAGPVDCWVVTTDYNRPGAVATFWFAKTTQLMVRNESTVGPNKVFIKTLLD
jgi:hypothetical protein